MRFLPKFLFIIALLIQFATPGSIWGSPGGMVFYTDWTESPGHIYYYGSGSEWQLFDSPAGGIYAAAIGHGGSLHYSDANGTKIYRLLNGQPFEVYSHTTYVRDIGFDEQGSLYFSEASGAGGDGIIYSLKDGQSSIFCRVEISKVRGFWSGNFAFDPDGRLYISSGNTSGGTLYRMDKSTPIPVYDRHSTSEVIAGFDFDARGEVYYTDWGTTIYRLDLSTQTRTLYRQDAARSYANVWVSKGIITVGPEAGRVNRIAHHPTAGNIVYAGSSSGGVFRSNDSGASWTLRTAGITDGQIGGLSLYPPKPTVLIAASPSGIYRSENEGLTWTNVLSTPRTLPPNPLDGTIWEMQKSPVCYDAATRALYAAPRATGLYKSSDGGKTWKQVFGAGSTTRKNRCVLDILIAPEGGGTVYIATLDGIRKNVGGNGPLWPLYATEIKNASNTPLIPVTMRIAPSQKDLFYVTTFNMSPRDSSIWRRDTVTGKFKNRPMGKPSWYSWCPLWSLAVHPTEKYRIFMGAVYLHTSSSAGDLSMYFHKYSASTAGIGPDYRHLEIDPAGKSLYAALDHGILRYDFAAKKSSAIEKGLTNTQLYDLDVGPAGTVYIATQDTGAFRKKNAKPWDFDVKADGTGDVLEVLAHPSDDSRLFIRNNNPELLISSKYGSTFTKSKGLPFGGWWNHLLVYVPSKKILYAGAAGQGIFKSTDDGKNFKPTNMGIQYLSPRCLAGLPGDATTLYVGTLDKGLYKTVDGAVSWQQVPTFPKTAVLSLLVAANGSQVFAGTASGVYLSQDGGKTWNPRNTGLPSRKVVSELTADPTNANSIYAGLGYYSWEGLYGGGVYRSQDNGKTWHSLLPQKDRYVNVTSIRFDPKEKSRIWVGTFGSGVVTLFKEN